MAKLTITEIDNWIEHELYSQSIDLDNLQGKNIENIKENIMIRIMLLKSQTMHDIFDLGALRTYICTYIYQKYNRLVKEPVIIEVQSKWSVFKWLKLFFKTLKLKLGIA